MSTGRAGPEANGRAGAYLEAVQDAVAAKQLALTGVLGGPGEDFVAGVRHDRRMS